MHSSLGAHSGSTQATPPCHPLVGRFSLPFRPLAFSPHNHRDSWKLLHPSNNMHLPKQTTFSANLQSMQSAGLYGGHSSAFVPASFAFLPFPYPLSVLPGVDRYPYSPLNTSPPFSRHDVSDNLTSTSTSAPKLQGASGCLELSSSAPGTDAAGGSSSSQTEKVDCADLRELEQFALSFKSRRIKLGFTQTNVGE